MGSSGTTLQKSFGSQTTIIVGFAYKILAYHAQGCALIDLYDQGNLQADFGQSADGTIHFGSQNSVQSLNLNTWNFVEIKVVVGSALTGTYELRVNGTVWLSGMANTNPSGSGFVSQIIMASRGFSQVNDIMIDDFHICNGLGSVNNDFLGDTMISVIYPNGPGALTQWLPISGANYQMVNEALVDDDLTYNYATAPGQVDLYTLQQLPFTPARIMALQWNGQLRKNDASSYVLNSVMRPTTIHFGATGFTPNTSYVDDTDVYEQNPDTVANWTLADVNALQAGIRLNSII